MEKKKKNQVNPSKIIQIGMGFWASKTLLTAVNMGLFTHLTNGELSGQDIKEKIKKGACAPFFVSTNLDLFRSNLINLYASRDFVTDN